MKEKDKSGSSCFVVLLVSGFIAFLLYGSGTWLYRIWEFVNNADLMQHSLVVIEGALACGGGILLLALLAAFFSPAKLKSTEDDDYD